MVLCVDPLGLGFSDEDLVAVGHLCHTKSSSVTSVQNTSWPGHLETGLCFISLLQLSSWETLTVVIMCTARYYGLWFLAN